MVALTSLLALISTTTSLVQAIPVERNNDKSDACQRMIGNIAGESRRVSRNSAKR
jgi:hypothetical protein